MRTIHKTSKKIHHFVKNPEERQKYIQKGFLEVSDSSILIFKSVFCFRKIRFKRIRAMSFHSKGYHFMRALITGASGFIGRNLLKRLLLLENQFEEIITVTRTFFIIPNKKVKNFACDLGDSKKFELKTLLTQL